jgi:hypothetical protein
MGFIVYHLLRLLAVIRIVKGQTFFTAGGACTPFCENVYREARKICPSLPSNPLSQALTYPSPLEACKLNIAFAGIDPLGFNSTCLCTGDTFRERAPACIDCLFRNVIEEDARDYLLKGMDGCTKSLGLSACPSSCAFIEQLMEQCEEEDNIKAATVVAAASLSGNELGPAGLSTAVGTDMLAAITDIPTGYVLFVGLMASDTDESVGLIDRPAKRRKLKKITQKDASANPKTKPPFPSAMTA